MCDSWKWRLSAPKQKEARRWRSFLVRLCKGHLRTEKVGSAMCLSTICWLGRGRWAPAFQEFIAASMGLPEISLINFTYFFCVRYMGPWEMPTWHVKICSLIPLQGLHPYAQLHSFEHHISTKSWTVWTTSQATVKLSEFQQCQDIVIYYF